MQNWEKILEEVELSFLQHVVGDLKKRRKLIPINNPDRHPSLIWNILTDPKFRDKISPADFQKIYKELLNRQKDYGN